MKSNKSLLYFLVLLIVTGLACQTVTGTTEGTDPQVTLTAETNLPPVEEPVIDPTSEPLPTDVPAVAEPTAVPSLDDALEEYPGLSQAHEQDPVYFEKDMPPPGGVHAPAWLNCGIYTEPVEAKNAIHSLEHGAVWLTYDPELPETDIKILQELAADQAYTILSPFPGLRTSVVIVAWGLRFQTDSVTDARILEFLLTYQQGPQTPEPGAPCQGGLGSPTSPGSLGFSTS